MYVPSEAKKHHRRYHVHPVFRLYDDRFSTKDAVASSLIGEQPLKNLFSTSQ